MGDPKRPPSSMEWDATLGGMLKHRITVRRGCKACGAWVLMDVEALARRLGPAASLWDLFEDCPDCEDGLTAYHAQTGRSTPFRPLSHYLVIRTLDRMGWEFYPLFPSIPPYGYGVPADRR